MDQLNGSPRLLTVMDRGQYLGTLNYGTIKHLLELANTSPTAVEAFVLVVLDSQDYVKSTKLISLGGPSSVMVSLRDTFREAVSHDASTKILVSHNHPNGFPKPSREDQALTASIKQAGEFLGVQIVDHIIIGATSFYSFALDDEFETNGNVAPFNGYATLFTPKEPSAQLPRSHLSDDIRFIHPAPNENRLKYKDYFKHPEQFPPKPFRFIGFRVWWSEETQSWKRAIDTFTLVGKYIWSWLL